MKKTLLILFFVSIAVGCGGGGSGGPQSSTAPEAPSHLEAESVSTNSISLQWRDNADNEDGFAVELSTNGGTTFTDLARVEADRTTWTADNLQPETTYHFRIHAFRGDHLSGHSNVLAAKTASPVSKTFSLTIEEPGHVDRPAEPVSIGVPFPKGRLWNPEQAGIQGVATQNRLLSRWPDGSCQWVLLDFQRNLTASATSTLVVSDDDRTKADGMTVTEEPDSITVNTGPLKASFARTGFDPLQSIWLDANDDGRFDAQERLKQPEDPCRFYFDYEIVEPEKPKTEEIRNDPVRMKYYRTPEEGGGFYYTNEQDPLRYDYIWMRKSRQGQIYRQIPRPETVSAVVQERGPLKTVVKVSGWFENQSTKEPMGQFVLRFYFYADKPYFRIQNTFIASYENRGKYLRQFAFEIPTDLGQGALAYHGQPADQLVSGPFSDNVCLLTEKQDPDPFGQHGLVEDWPAGYFELENPATYSMTADGRQQSAGKMADGWLGASGQKAKAMIGVRDFAQLYPCSLELVAGRPAVLKFGLWPEAGGWSLHHGETVGNPNGTAITHNCIVGFFAPETKDDTLRQTWQRFQDPVFPVIEPDYLFNQVRNIGTISKPRPGFHDGMESLLAATAAATIRASSNYYLDGKFNFGSNPKAMFKNRKGKTKADKWFLGVEQHQKYDAYDGFAHHNNFVDYTFFIQALRAGHYPLRRHCERLWLHNRDVCTLQWQPQGLEKNIGMGMRHCAYQWGSTRRTTNEGKAFHRLYGNDPLSGWLHWNLTGDWRTLEALHTYAYRYFNADKVSALSHDSNDGAYGALLLPIFALIPDFPEREAASAHGSLLAGQCYTSGQAPYHFIWEQHFSGLRSAYRPMAIMLNYYITGDDRIASAFPHWAAKHVETIKASDSSYHRYGVMPIWAFGYHLTGNSDYKDQMEQALAVRKHLPRENRFREVGYDGFLNLLPEKELFEYVDSSTHTEFERKFREAENVQLFFRHIYAIGALAPSTP